MMNNEAVTSVIEAVNKYLSTEAAVKTSQDNARKACFQKLILAVNGSKNDVSTLDKPVTQKKKKTKSVSATDSPVKKRGRPKKVEAPATPVTLSDDTSLSGTNEKTEEQFPLTDSNKFVIEE